MEAVAEKVDWMAKAACPLTIDETQLKLDTLEWLGKNRFCPASFTLAMACCGIENAEATHPESVRNLERCLAYLDDVPAARLRLLNVRDLSPKWASILRRLATLRALLREECGVGFSYAFHAPKTETLIQKALREAEA